jgi:WD40 repeat protein
LSSFAFVDEGRSIVSASLDGHIRKWDVASGNELFRIDTQEDRWLFDASAAVKSNLIAVTQGITSLGYPATRSGRAAVWDLDSRPRLTRFDELIGPPSVAFSPDDRLLAVGDHGGTLRLVDAATWKVVETIQTHEAPIPAITYSPDGRILATASGVWHDRFVAGEIKLWDAGNWTETGVLHNHTDAVKCVACSRDGRYLAAGSRDRCMSLWGASS